MIKINSVKAFTIYSIINKAKLGSKMSDECKFAVIKIVRALKPFATYYEESLRDASQRLMPENFAPIGQKVEKGQLLTEEEHRIFTKFNQDIENCMKQEAETENEIDTPLLSEGMMKELIASNSFSVSEIMSLYDTIVQ